jgi:hypothetical protein
MVSTPKYRRNQAAVDCWQTRDYHLPVNWRTIAQLRVKTSRIDVMGAAVAGRRREEMALGVKTVIAPTPTTPHEYDHGGGVGTLMP